MRDAYAPVHPPLGAFAARTAGLLAAIVAALFFGVAFALVLYLFPVPLVGGVAAGIGLLASLAFALVRYDTTVALGFLGLGIVLVEPAPSDLIFSILIIVSLMTGRFYLGRVPLLIQTLVGIFLALNILAATAIVDLPTAIRFFAITAYLVLFAGWLTSHVSSEDRARNVLRAYVLGAVLWAALGSAAVLFEFPGRESLLFFDRAKALFKDPNVFGPFLVPAALLLIDELVRPRHQRLSRLRAKTLVALLAVIAVGVLFSYSRAAYLNFLVSIVVMSLVIPLRRGGSGKAMAFLGILLSSTALLGMVVAATSSVDFLKERARIQGYDAERFEAHERGIGLIEDYPFGIGPGQFEPAIPNAPAAHSLYIRTLTEEGVLGLVVISALILTTLVLALWNAGLGRSTYGIGSTALLGAWCGLVANSFFVDTLHWRHLWVVAGLIWAGAMRPPSRTERTPPHFGDRAARLSRA